MSLVKNFCVISTLTLTVCFLYVSYTILSPMKSNGESGIVVSNFRTGDTQQELNSESSKAKKTVDVWIHDLVGDWSKKGDICQHSVHDTIATLITPYGKVPIHIHDPKNDIWVSRRIINTGSFDLDKIKIISKFMESDSTLSFIDIGANLGTYSLSFAKFGRNVLAIDALNLNMKKLCRSVNDSHFEDHFFMVMNAVSSQHEIVKLAADEKNFGGTFVDDNADHIKSIKGGSVSGRHYNEVTTIVLDDLLSLPFISLFQNVLIKMDIEGFEHKALERAYQFFSKIFVQGVQIEWIFHRNTSSGQVIVDFLTKHSYVPYNPQTLRPLRKSSMGNWAIQDVLWLRH